MASLTQAQHNEFKRIGTLIEQERAAGRRQLSQSVKNGVVALHRQGVGVTVICDILKLASSLVYRWKSGAVPGPCKAPRVFSIRPQPEGSPNQTMTPNRQALHVSLGQFSLTIQIA
jgi:hypothetical protein